jgi:ppGpp synthetase/RelA/SpoT-type nucleotidyltranferase
MVSDDQMARRRTDVLEWYADARHKFIRTEELVTRMVRRALRESGNDSAKVESRVKDPTSLADKAVKLESDGSFKYDDPRQEITDYIGLRVLVPLRTELPTVTRLLDELFVVVEKSELRKGMTEDVPGYQSTHLLVRLRPETLADVDFQGIGDPVLEVQVRTILQHAWASLQHDLMYKTERPPGPDIRRRLIALAGLLELAEREFILVRHDHGEVFADQSLADASEMAAEHPSSDLVRELFGEEVPAHRAWHEAVDTVCTELGLQDVDALRAALDDWRERAREVASAVRATSPWATAPYLLDMLLRLALDDEYLSRRSPEGVTEHDREQFAAERAELERRLDGRVAL